MNIAQLLTKLKALIYSKSETDSLLGGKANSSHTHTKSQITDFPSYGNTAGTICQGNDSRLSDARTPTSHTHTKSQITDFPTIPTVNNATLKIQKNGTDVKTFTANASSDVTCNITVPTKVSELSNDSGFLTSHQSLSNYSTLANTIKALSISGKTITYTKGDNTTGTLTTQDTNTTYSNFVKSGSGAKAGLVPAPSTTAGTTKYLREDGTWQVPPDHTYTVNNATLTIQKNGSNVATFTANASSNATANITVPTKVSQLTNDSGFITSSGSCNYANSAGSAKVADYAKLLAYSHANEINFMGGRQATCYFNYRNADDDSTGTAATVEYKFCNYGGNSVSNVTVSAGTFKENGSSLADKYQAKGSYASSSHTHTKSQITDFPTIPTVNNATLTIQKNGSNVATFTANASSNVTANISVPTKVSQLTNDSGFITSSVASLELKSSNPYIDFHACNSTQDYTSRIVDDGTAVTGSLRLVTLVNSVHYQVELYKNYFEPVGDTDINLGDSTNRWKNIFCATDSISTSDLRLKNTITDIDDSLLDAWGNIEPKQYKFNDATEEKGDKARYHTGYLAQDIQTECEKQGVNASDYGLFCYDEWDEQEEVSEEIEKEKDGKIVKEKRIIQPKREKGDRYSLRYAEALVVECKYLRRENSRLKENLASIEERLEKLEKAENS